MARRGNGSDGPLAFVVPMRDELGQRHLAGDGGNVDESAARGTQLFIGGSS